MFYLFDYKMFFHVRGVFPGIFFRCYDYLNKKGENSGRNCNYEMCLFVVMMDSNNGHIIRVVAVENEEVDVRS